MLQCQQVRASAVERTSLNEFIQGTKHSIYLKRETQWPVDQA